MRQGKLFLVTLLVLAVVLICGVALAGCKPGYREVWEPIAPYDYNSEWDPSNGDLETVTARVNADCIADIKAEREAYEEKNRDQLLDGTMQNIYDPEYLMSQIATDGSFKCIPYNKNTKEGYWYPLDHLKYVLYLQVARCDEDNTDEEQKARIRDSVSLAMRHWVDAAYFCTWNWWPNEVGVGMYLPNIILFGVDGLSETETNKMLSNVEKTLLHTKPMRFKLYERQCNEAGGNLADQALSTLKFCLVKRDGNTIRWVTHQIENELRVFPPYKGPNYHRWDAEGIKEDWSFQQHDQLVYFGGYGEVMLDGFNKYIKYTSGTKFALKKERLEFYADFVMNGMQFATRNGYRDISGSGRGAARRNALTGIYENVRRTAELLISEGIRVDELTALLENRYGEVDKGAGGHRYFYESDYSVYNGAKYMASVRHASERTRVYEYLNGENPLAYYTGFGATFYYVDGDEYYNALPLYDWNKIPGTTTRQGYMVKMDEGRCYGLYNNTEYVMGVSNGKVGASYIRLDDKGVKGKKAYFMFEDGVVCLGADIRSGKGESILTNINQTNLDGDVIVRQNGTKTTNANISGVVDYVYHDKIAYITKNSIDLSIRKGVKGDWKSILEQTGHREIVGDIFMLDIDHGKRPKGASYDYTVLMNTSVEAADEYITAPIFKTIANNKSVQAVYDTKKGILEAVFHDKGSLVLPNGETLTVSEGCVLIVEGDKITIASHDYRTREMTITLGSKSVTKSVGKRPITIQY